MLLLNKNNKKKIEFKFFIKKELSKTYRFYKILCLIPGKSFQYMYCKISLVEKSFKANNSKINYQLFLKSQISFMKNLNYFPLTHLSYYTQLNFTSNIQNEIIKKLTKIAHINNTRYKHIYLIFFNC